MATEVRGAIAGDAITYAYTVAFKTFDVGSGALLLALRIGEALPQVASFFREVDAGAAAGHDRFGEPCCADGHCEHDDPDRELFCAGRVVSGGVQRALVLDAMQAFLVLLDLRTLQVVADAPVLHVVHGVKLGDETVLAREEVVDAVNPDACVATSAPGTKVRGDKRTDSEQRRSNE